MKIVVNSKERRDLAISLVKGIRKEDCPMMVTIEPFIEGHSDDQRGLFHSLCRELGHEIGYNEAEIKEYVKGEILGTRLIKIGDKEKEVVCSSEYDETGKKRDKISYSTLIEGLYRIAAEAGIHL